MIVVTGAAGFIGSNIVADLMMWTKEPICVCDWRCRESPNLASHHRIRGVFDAECTPEQLHLFLEKYHDQITAIIHMGAISSTTETDRSKLLKNNTQLTVDLWLWCAQNNKRIIYASSASVYGNNSTFWDSDHPKHMNECKPLNWYGKSKLAADIAISTLAQINMQKPKQWAALRFFNVYGPNEWHKGDQASLITKSYGKKVIELFETEARRDFVYVKDCSLYVLKLLESDDISGVFNIGTEEARPFEDIASIMGAEIAYVPVPEAIKPQYQAFTKAGMSKAKRQGLWFPPTSLEDGIQDYTEKYLLGERRHR